MPGYYPKTGFSSQMLSGVVYVIFLLFFVALRSLLARIADYRRIKLKQAHMEAAENSLLAPSTPASNNSRPTGILRYLSVAHPLPTWSSLFGTTLGASDCIELFVILAANVILMIIPLPYPTAEQVANGQIWDVNAVSKRMAWIGCGNSFWIFFTATRNSLLTLITSVPFERHLTYHRWFGYLVFFQFTMHSILTFVHLGRTGKLAVEVTTLVNIFGIVSWICLVLLSVLSIPVVRRKFFRTFYVSHFLFVPFIVFGSFHRPTLAWFAALGLVAWLGDRAIRALKSWSTVEVLDSKVLHSEDGSACSKLVVRANTERPWASGWSHKEAGQYAFLSVQGPQSRFFSRLLWHPLSASSPPSHDGTVTFHTKVAGPFSHALASALSSHSDPENQAPEIQVRLDGHYGKLRTDFSSSQTVVLIAGGIGLAPMIALAQDLVSKMLKPLGDYENGPTLAWETRHVSLVWYVHTASEFGWFEDQWTQLERDGEVLVKLGKFVELKVYVTRGEAPVGSRICVAGKPQVQELIPELVGGDEQQGEKTAVAVCGPSGLVRDVRQTCADLVLKGVDVDVHWELFEL